MILGVYKITYHNGVSQHKNLIDHSEYLSFKEAVDDLVTWGGGDKAIQKLQKAFKKENGDEFFTTLSPLGLAINTGKLVLPETQGGTTNCHIVLAD